MNRLIQTLISGLSLGSIYALIALGYTMVYGIAKMLNFAHGDIIMIGAYTCIAVVNKLGLSPVIGAIISIIFCSLLGMIIEMLAYRPLRQAQPLAVLITAIGISYLLQNLALLIFGSEQLAYPAVIHLPDIIIGDIQIDGKAVSTLLVTSVVMLVLHLFVTRTKLGTAMRAVSEDKEAAQLMGINVNRTITISALAAVASIFYGSIYVYIRPTTGSMPGIKAFTAAVFGGIGSLPGAMLGGLLLGIIEQFSKAYISTLMADAIVFFVLVLVLVIRPAGLLGKLNREKV